MKNYRVENNTGSIIMEICQQSWLRYYNPVP